MKKISTLLFAAAVGLVALSGCASPTSSKDSAAMGDMSMSDGDMKSMCEKHMKMMGSMSPADQKAMMDAHMKDMSPAMREKHMKEMAMCK
jgi:outer membrane murein-binding lipoprotein Lpp